MTIDIDVFGVRMKNSISSDMESYFIFIQKKEKKVVCFILETPR